MFPLAQKYVERVVLVEDEAIRRAQQALWDVLRVRPSRAARPRSRPYCRSGINPPRRSASAFSSAAAMYHMRVRAIFQ